MRRGEGTALACRRHARWRRCRCGWAPPSGAAASAGGAVPPGGRPCGGVSPAGAAAAGVARRCPAAAGAASFRRQAPLPVGCQPRRQQADCRPAAAGTALAHAPVLCCLATAAAAAAGGCRHADRGQQLLLPFLAFASTILTSKFFLNTIHEVQNQSFARTTWL